MKLLDCVRALFGRAISPVRDRAIVDETKELLAEVEAEWQPIRERIAQEEQHHPDLAAALRHARRNLPSNNPLGNSLADRRDA